MKSDFSLLCLDVGNTHVGVALFQDGAFTVLGKYKTASFVDTLREKISSWEDEYQVSRAVFCSVVPRLNAAMIDCFSLHEWTVRQLTHDQYPIPIDYPAPREIGQDRLANALGAWQHYSKNAVVIDFGTATNFDVVRAQTGYEGGILTPGLSSMSEYLHEKTALLPKIDIATIATEAVIGKSTYEAMQVGAYQGYIGMIDYLLRRLKEKHFGEETFTCILTGGASYLFAEQLYMPVAHDPLLTMKGLVAFYFS